MKAFNSLSKLCCGVLGREGAESLNLSMKMVLCTAYASQTGHESSVQDCCELNGSVRVPSAFRLSRLSVCRISQLSLKNPSLTTLRKMALNSNLVSLAGR